MELVIWVMSVATVWLITLFYKLFRIVSYILFCLVFQIELDFHHGKMWKVVGED